MPSQEMITQKNSVAKAEQVSKNSLELLTASQLELDGLTEDEKAIQQRLPSLSGAVQFSLDAAKYNANDVLQEELHRIELQEEAIAEPEKADKPPQVFLFSGHMIDSLNRPQPRFPADMEAEAQQKINQVLDKLQADANHLAIAPGIACGGDILFLEACLERQMKVEVYLPFEPAKFIKQSVSFAGDDWVERFYKIKNHPQVKIHLQLQRLGPVPEGDDPFERNNRWALYSSLGYGIDRIRLVVLWDGKGGDGKGGTGDMVNQVRQLGGIVEHLDTTKFDYWETKGKDR